MQFLCDNSAVVDIINTGSSPDRASAHFMRCLTLAACRHHFSFSARHVRVTSTRRLMRFPVSVFRNFTVFVLRPINYPPPFLRRSFRHFLPRPRRTMLSSLGSWLGGKFSAHIFHWPAQVLDLLPFVSVFVNIHAPPSLEVSANDVCVMARAVCCSSDHCCVTGGGEVPPHRCWPA